MDYDLFGPRGVLLAIVVSVALWTCFLYGMWELFS